MNSIITLYLKVKHWQVFIIIFVLPSLIRQLNFEEWILFGKINVSELISFIPLILLVSWFYFVGIGLKRYVPNEVSLKSGKFKFLYVFTVVYTVIFVSFFSYISEYLSFSKFFIMLPLHMFSTYSMVYVLYYVTKIIKTCELKREVYFHEFTGLFFGIWMFPIGIWFAQSKINKIAKTTHLDKDLNSK
ncbi:MAG: hypothetical protein OCD01_00600 [Fibrobacterales bacterium]